MKKIINILLAVCLMVSVLAVSALAEGEEAVYPGPETHTLPAFIDFNDEGITTYDGIGADESKHFYYLNSYSYIAAKPEDATDKFLWIRGSTAVAGSMAIKFDDFMYDETAVDGVQPKKLVISFDADYKFAANDNEAYRFNNTTMAANIHQHIAFGANDSITANKTNFSNWNGKGRDGLFFNWDYDVDTTNKKVTNTLYGYTYSVNSLDATAMNNQAHLAKINNGDTINYTYVMDLTRDENNHGNVIVYIDGESSGKLVADCNQGDDNEDGILDPVEKINTFLMTANKKNSFAVDNVRIYTIDNAKIAATGASVSGTDVPLTTEEVTVNFSHEITKAADKYIVVKKGDDVLTAGEDYTIEHVFDTTDARTAKALKVKFADTLSYGTTYSVCGSVDYFGIDGYALGEETEFASFTTEAAPQINLSTLAIKKGFFGDIDVTSLADCLGSTVSLTTTATSAESNSTIATVFFGVYKNDVLVNLAMVNKTFAPEEADEITVNIMLPSATASDVVEIKAFACEGLGNLDAYGTVQSISTAD